MEEKRKVARSKKLSVDDDMKALMHTEHCFFSLANLLNWSNFSTSTKSALLMN